MKIHRRTFLKSVAAISGSQWLGASVPPGESIAKTSVLAAKLEKILNTPVLDLSQIAEPVIVESIELLLYDRTYLIKTRSKAGVEVVTVPNALRMRELYPMFTKRIAPFFIGKDMRFLEEHLTELYRNSSNYKFQGLALWVPVAAAENAMIELLAHTAQTPLANFFGGQHQHDIAVYYASGNRGNTPEAEIEHLQNLVEDSGVLAIKFRLGARMSRNRDDPPGRTEALIPLVREVFGDTMTLYADANSSYDVQEGIRIGRMMEDHGYGFYEEPCPFDNIWETKAVADALNIPVAGGEQEFSLRRFRWAIENQGLDIVQPDLHYGGGLIRATKVARMAAAAGLTVVPHMSGGGLGYVDVVHYASFTPNIGPFMEFKGNTDIPIECDSSSLRCENGIVRAPNGIGWGVKIDPDYIKAAEIVSKIS
jgi:L-alanine-DL-glutamate epimerase-like enolase superfamily enzyme